MAVCLSGYSNKSLLLTLVTKQLWRWKWKKLVLCFVNHSAPGSLSGSLLSHGFQDDYEREERTVSKMEHCFVPGLAVVCIESTYIPLAKAHLWPNPITVSYGIGVNYVSRRK